MNCKRFLTGFAALAACAAFADEFDDNFPPTAFDASTGFVTLKADNFNVEPYKPNTSFSCAMDGGVTYGWSDTQAPHPGTNYYAGSTLYTPTGSDSYEFGGDRLVIAKGKTLQHLTAASAGGVKIAKLYLLEGSAIDIWGIKDALQGDLHVYGTQAKPSLYKYDLTGSTPQPFGMRMFGEVGSAFAFMPVASRAGQQPVFVLTNDLSGFYGTLIVESNVTVRAALPTMGGTVEVRPFGRFRTYGDSAPRDASFGAVDVRANATFQLSATNVCTVSNATFAADSTLEVGCDAKAQACGLLDVTNALSVAGPVKLRVATGWSAKTNAPPVYALIRLAPGATGTLSTDDFTIVDDGATRTGSLPHAKLFVRQDDDQGQTLCLTFKPIVTQVKSSKKDAESPLLEGNEASWSNNALPQEGYDYLSSSFGYLHSGSEPAVFNGDCLVLNGGSIYGAGGAVPGLVCREIELVVGSTIRAWNGAFTVSGGKVSIASGKYFSLEPYGNNGNQFVNIESEITGAGNVKVTSVSSSSATGSRGNVRITQLNTNFTGYVFLTMVSDATRDYGPVPSDWRTTFTHITDGRNLGGPLAAFTYNSLGIEQYACLVADADVSLDQANRGVSVTDHGQIDTGTHTVRLLNPLTLDGELVKYGSGTLALGGKLRFGTNGNLDDATAPTEGRNVIAVTNGTLQALSVDALDGAAVSFRNGAGLLVDLAATGDLAESGFRSVKALSSLEGADGGAIPVSFTSGTAVSGEKSVAICTSKRDDLAFALGKPGKGRRAALRTVKNGDGADATYTYFADVAETGLIIQIR